MRKKVLAIMLATALCVSFAACGDNNTEEKNTESSVSEETVKESETETTVEGEGVIELGQYKGLTVNVAKTEVSDEDIVSYRDYLFNAEASKLDWNKAAEMGDTLDIDFVGKIDGEAFEGGSSENYSIVLGSNTFFAGFEDAMVGMVEGEVRDLELQFPDDYWSEDLAGKPCVFTVTCNKIVPAISDEAVAALQSNEFSTVEEFTEAAKLAVELYYENSYETSVMSEVLTKLLTSCTFGTLPEDKLAKQVEFVIENYSSLATEYGLDLDTYFSYYGTTTEEVASNYVKRDLLFYAIAEAEGFTATDEEVEEYAANLIKTSGLDMTVEELFETDPREEYVEYVIFQKVYDLILEETIVEAPVEE